MKTPFCLLALAIVSIANALSASEAMLGYTGTTSDSFSPINAVVPGTIGWTFQPLTSLSVTALGAFTYNLPSGSTDVGLWSSDGTLLASSVITSGSTLVDQSRYESITPILLTPGQTYYLGEFSSSGPIQSIAVYPTEPSGPDGYATMSPDIQLDDAAWQTNSIFEFPSITVGSPGAAIIAPNFQFQIIPEPSAVCLLGISSLILLAGRRLLLTTPHNHHVHRYGCGRLGQSH
jgi:hypothetical protein